MMVVEIINQVTGDRTIGIKDEDFEYVNPIEHFQANFIMQCLIDRNVEYDELTLVKEISENTKNMFPEISQKWAQIFQEISSLNISKGYLELLGTSKKKVQVELLKDIIVTPQILTAIVLQSYLNFGFTFSQYITEYLPQRTNPKDLPLMIHSPKNGELKVQGSTPLSNAQLKQIVEHRKVLIAKFIDKGDEWHCFFGTYKSMSGGESWKDDTPHLHYISSTFGIAREKVVQQLKSRKYTFSSLPHIELKRS